MSFQDEDEDDGLDPKDYKDFNRGRRALAFVGFPSIGVMAGLFALPMLAPISMFWYGVIAELVLMGVILVLTTVGILWARDIDRTTTFIWIGRRLRIREFFRRYPGLKRRISPEDL